MINNIKTPLYFLRKILRPSQVKHMGVKLRIDFPHISEWIRDAIYKGFYESFEARLMQRHIHACDRVLEIGGGIGLIGAVCKKASSLVIYEANPKLKPIIEYNLAINKVQAEVYSYAIVGEECKSKIREFYIGEHFWNASLTPVNGFTKHDVETVKFSSSITTHNPTFLVVDVEGYECELFKNINIPHCVTKILIEMHPKRVDAKAIDDLDSAIKSQGFSKIEQNSEVYFYKRV